MVTAPPILLFMDRFYKNLKSRYNKLPGTYFKMSVAVFHEWDEEDVDWYESACEEGNSNTQDRGEGGTQFSVMVALVETHVQHWEDQNQLKPKQTTEEQQRLTGMYFLQPNTYQPMSIPYICFSRNIDKSH